MYRKGDVKIPLQTLIIIIFVILFLVFFGIRFRDVVSKILSI